MNIVIITGSHRGKSNSQILADHFSSGAEAAGHKIFMFRAAHKKIHPCIGCDECHMDGPCIYKDDMEELREPLIAADAVVLASPMYYFGFSAQIKKAIDRFYAFNGHITGKKKACLLAAYGGGDPRTVAGMASQYDIICAFLQWQDCGKILVPNVNAEGEVLKTDFPQKAYELGKNI